MPNNATQGQTSLREISAVLTRIAAEVSAVAEPQRAPHPATPGEGMTVARYATLARQIYETRRRRDRTFGDNADLLGEPTWDILLYLFAAHCDGSMVSVSSACFASGVPATTGLRHVQRLEQQGMATRSADPFDRRRQFLTLTERGNEVMRKVLDTYGAAAAAVA